MWWLCTRTERIFAAMLLALALMPAYAAPSLESALMPGQVIRGHADVEAACDKCHVRFDRDAQPRLCLNCHKEVAADIRGRGGYHGRIQESECRSCHTEHKGRDARVVHFDSARFDHGLTDYALRGKHRSAQCASCHRAGEKFRVAPNDCNGCHRKDDFGNGHKGGLGPKCGNCHNEASWKEGRFDHDKTRFPLRRSHVERQCTDCHLANRYADTPRDCVSCHRQDDAHKGLFGARCESCHGEVKWKSSAFRHERYVLLDRHRAVTCATCHRTSPMREKTSTRCVACHRGDDVHKSALGDNCDSCHSEKGWKNSRFDHDQDTQFALRDRHRTAKCGACHRDEGFRNKLATACVKCHEQDDRDKGHKGRFGEKCGTCHTEKSFRGSIFDHARETPFALAGKHAVVKCESCHRKPLFQDQMKLESLCIACHKNDDVHFDSFGKQCDDCHVADNWRRIVKRAGSPSTGMVAVPGKGR